MDEGSPKIGGIIPPILTPFDEKGELNEDGQRKIVSFLNDYVHGYYVCGTYGSGPLMNLEERKRTLEIIMDESKEEKSVIAHIGSPSPETSLELGKHAEEHGADAVASVPPYYYTHREEEVKRHFEILREGLDLPMFFYNNPNTTGFTLTADFFKTLIEEELVDGIKDSSFDLMLFYNLVRKTEETRLRRENDFTFIIGTEALIVPGFLAGAKGSVAGLANSIPEECVECYEAVTEGNIEKAQDLQELILEERDITHIGPTIPTVHAILKIRGLDVGYPRTPFQMPDEETYREIENQLNRLGIKEI